MPSSYVSNHVHIVFSTKNRLKVIPEDLQPKLCAYMAGIAKRHRTHAVAIGGIEDHAHALIDMGPTLGIAKAAQVVKANPRDSGVISSYRGPCSKAWACRHPGGLFACRRRRFGLSECRAPGWCRLL